jgi:hypothetical protein
MIWAEHTYVSIEDGSKVSIWYVLHLSSKCEKGYGSKLQSLEEKKGKTSSPSHYKLLYKTVKAQTLLGCIYCDEGHKRNQSHIPHATPL